MLEANMNSGAIEGGANCGLFVLDENENLIMLGFHDLRDQQVRISILDNAVILMKKDEEIPEEECVVLNCETLSNPIVVDYLKKHDAINSLFVKLFGVYSQVIGIRVNPIYD